MRCWHLSAQVAFAVLLLGSESAAEPGWAQSPGRPLESSTLIAFGPEGEASFPRGLGASRELATRLGYDFRVIAGPPPAWIERVFSGGIYSSAVYVPPLDVATGYIIVPSVRDPTLVRGDVRPLTLRSRIWIAELPELARYYLGLWPIILGIVAISALTVTRRPENGHTWVRLTNWISALSALVYLPLLLNEAADPLNSIIGRDIAGALIVAVGLPKLTGVVSWPLIRSGARAPIRVLIPLCLALALLAASPIALLLVHCTSGDCL